MTYKSETIKKNKLTEESFRKELNKAITKIQMKYAMNGLVYTVVWNWHKIDSRRWK